MLLAHQLVNGVESSRVWLTKMLQSQILRSTRVASRNVTELRLVFLQNKWMTLECNSTEFCSLTTPVTSGIYSLCATDVSTGDGELSSITDGVLVERVGCLFIATSHIWGYSHSPNKYIQIAMSPGVTKTWLKMSLFTYYLVQRLRMLTSLYPSVIHHHSYHKLSASY